MGSRGILQAGRVCALAGVAALLALVPAWPAGAQVVCTGGGCGGGGGTVTSPVATDPITFSGAGTCDNAANTPWVFADGVTSPSLASAAGANLALSATAPAATTGASQAGKTVTVTASNAVASTDTASAAAGGSVTITAGAAARNTSGNANGGDINLVTGAGIGTGTAGQVLIPVGTAAKPGLAFTGETTDGIYALAGLDIVTIVSGGVATISANGGATQLRGPVTVMNSVPGGAGTGALYHALGVETVATTKSPVAGESGELYTNGADVDGQAITLLNDPTVGVCYEFALTSTDSSGAFVIAPSAGETLSDAGTSCATSFSATAKGATARICAVSGGSGALWLVMSKNGTWTCS